MRGDRALQRTTLVEFVTPGVLLRRLLTDPGLTGVDGVILDEVHSRSLEMDLLLGMVAEVRQMRPELISVAMSATIDPHVFSRLLDDAPVLVSEGRQFPVDISYAPFQESRFDDRGVSRRFLDHVADVTARAAWEHHGSDSLVFLPGRSEIFYVVDALRRSLPDYEILPLYSGVDTAISTRVLAGRGDGDPPRVIVSTDVAESSLTVPGVNLVIDSCLSREVRRDAGRAMSGLVTVTAARASSQQRSGRAGRLREGWAYRCIDEAGYAAARPAPTPEILTSDLTETALMLAAWGTPGGAGLTLVDSPPADALNDAHLELIRIGALGEDLRPTDLGRILATLPLSPNHGKGLIDGAAAFGQQAAAEIISLISMDLPSRDPSLSSLLRELSSRTHPQHGSWKSEATRLGRMRIPAPASPPPEFDEQHRLGIVAALAGGRIAKRDGDSYLFTSGTRGQLPPGSSLDGEEWLAVTNIARTSTRSAERTGAIIRAAAPITADAAAAIHGLTRLRRTSVDEGRVIGREERRLGGIVLSSTSVRPTADEAREALLSFISDEGLEVLPWTPAARNLRGRLSLLHRYLDGWPAVDDEALLSDLDWLAGFITGTSVKKIPVEKALAALVCGRAYELDTLAPQYLRVASGRDVRIDYPYPAGDAVSISVKLQECFGMATTPRIAGGQVPVAIELLSPAGRPLARTIDLEFFWREVYPQIRAENRARYAKHPWPEDPWTHKATAATTRQLRRR